jgi:hypothetical protein
MIKLFMVLLLFGCANRSREIGAQKFSDEIYQNLNLPYLPAEDSLRMLIRKEPLLEFYNKWDYPAKNELSPPDDFFITVIYPSEYKVLLTKLSKNEIDLIAKGKHIQNSRFNIICIGKYQDDFLLPVNSDDLVRIRMTLNELYLKRGGDSTAFNPTLYRPYIELSDMESDTKLSANMDKDLCVEKVGVYGY